MHGIRYYPGLVNKSINITHSVLPLEKMESTILGYFSLAMLYQEILLNK